MVIGATVFAVLILMLLLAERGSSRMWHNGAPSAFYYCRLCDLRYPRHELRDQNLRICPRGHYADPDTGFPFSTMFICACGSFIVAGVALIATGNAG